jgi:hypothetical protein
MHGTAALPAAPASLWTFLIYGSKLFLSNSIRCSGVALAHDVFISYADEDKLVAKAVCAKLEEKSIRCWLAPRDTRAGAEWQLQVLEAIESCRVVVLIFSRNAGASHQVQREVINAFEEEKTVIPFRIQEVETPRLLRLYMRNIHWLDALTPPLEKHIQTLIAEVGYKIHAPTDAQVASDPDVGATKRKIDDLEKSNDDLRRQLDRQKRRQQMLNQIGAAVAALVVVVSGALAIWSRSAAPQPTPVDVSIHASNTTTGANSTNGSSQLAKGFFP